MRSKIIFLSALIASFMLVNTGHAASKQYQNQDIEYNATPNSPTLPLRQTPPPQNYPTSVQVGTPSYYYYPVGAGYGPGGYGGGYGGGAQVGGYIQNTSGNNQRGFWFNTPIPGQAGPYGGAGYGPGGYGGYGPGGFGGGGGNILYVP